MTAWLGSPPRRTFDARIGESSSSSRSMEATSRHGTRGSPFANHGLHRDDGRPSICWGDDTTEWSLPIHLRRRELRGLAYRTEVLPGSEPRSRRPTRTANNAVTAWAFIVVALVLRV